LFVLLHLYFPVEKATVTLLALSTNGASPVVWWWMGFAMLCVQELEWTSSSRVILCQWRSTILTTN